MTTNNVYPNDSPEEAAKKVFGDIKWIDTPGNGNGNGNRKGKQVHFVQKHSEPGLLAEAVIVGGVPYFAVSRLHPDKKVEIALKTSIPIDESSEYKPFELSAYLSEPYRFKSKQDFESCFERARGETRDNLYRKVKSIWTKYIDADPFHISICAADTIFTYYQDKMGLTHYLFFVGGNNCGKSNNLLVLKYLAYRCFVSTDMTAPNIYQFLGSDEEGQGTLCEDEADRIDEDRQKMAIHKNGYIRGFPVARTDTSFGRKQMKFNTFCFKAFAAERFPDPTKAKGFNQRVIELQCSAGNPQYDIAEVTDETGAEEFQLLRDELNELHNSLLMVRLLHYHQVIPDIKLNIKGREKQLFKPVVRIFQKTETLTELLPVISSYVMQKREANYSSFNAFLYRAIKDLITDRQTAQLESAFMWNYIRENLQGAEIHGKPLSYDSSEFGELSQKEITQTLEHIFGARIKRSHGIRRLVFDVSKLKRLGNIYELSPEVKVLECDIKDDERVSDVSDVSDVGIGRYLAASTNEPMEIPKIRVSEREDTPDQGLPDSLHPSNAAHPTPLKDNAAMLKEYDRLSSLSRKNSKTATNVVSKGGTREVK